MAHELAEIKGQTAMFYYGDTPWHGLGTQVDHALIAEEAIKTANLDWTVDKKEIYFKTPEEEFTRGKGYCTVRTDENIPLGIVGENYKPIQNIEAFSFMDTLVLSQEAKYHTAGALYRGEKVWILAKIPSDMIITDEDIVNKYLLLVNNHNGRGALKVFFTPIRVVCQNTLTLALNKSSVSVNIIHKGDVHNKIEQAREILCIAVKYFDDMEIKFQDFFKKTITTAMLKEYTETVFPGTSTRTKNIRNKVMELCEIGAGSEYSCGTVWGAYNAAVEYVDHFRTDFRKYPNRYLDTINFGSGAEIKTRAFTEAAKLTYN